LQTGGGLRPRAPPVARRPPTTTFPARCWADAEGLVGRPMRDRPAEFVGGGGRNVVWAWRSADVRLGGDSGHRRAGRETSRGAAPWIRTPGPPWVAPARRPTRPEKRSCTRHCPNGYDVVPARPGGFADGPARQRPWSGTERRIANRDPNLLAGPSSARPGIPAAAARRLCSSRVTRGTVWCGVRRVVPAARAPVSSSTYDVWRRVAGRLWCGANRRDPSGHAMWGRRTNRCPGPRALSRGAGKCSARPTEGAPSASNRRSPAPGAGCSWRGGRRSDLPLHRRRPATRLARTAFDRVSGSWERTFLRGPLNPVLPLLALRPDGDCWVATSVGLSPAARRRSRSAFPRRVVIPGPCTEGSVSPRSAQCLGRQVCTPRTR